MANGVIIIDKPSGWTSMDVCAKLRGIFHERRVGHAGTLDPMATGVLPVFVGRATRAVEFAERGEKEYLAGLRLGLVTDTQDISGRVLEERPVHVEPSDLHRVLSAFRGDIMQVPPMYSAVKVNGKKLYELARKGREVERSARPVTIHSLEQVLIDEAGEETFPEFSPGPNVCFLRVRCSKGTYVRTLCHDIGAALGCGGCMSALRRTMACGFSLDRAVSLEAVQAAAERGEAESLLLPVDALFGAYPALTIDGRDLVRARNGGAFPCAAGDGLWRVYDPGGAFLLLGRCEGGAMKTVKSFFEV